MRSLPCVVLLFAVLPLAEVGQAQQASTTVVPNLITYSGTLHLPSGLESPARVVGATFAIYRQEDGGAPLAGDAERDAGPDRPLHRSAGHKISGSCRKDLFLHQSIFMYSVKEAAVESKRRLELPSPSLEVALRQGNILMLPLVVLHREYRLRGTWLPVL